MAGAHGTGRPEPAVRTDDAPASIIMRVGLTGQVILHVFSAAEGRTETTPAAAPTRLLLAPLLEILSSSAAAHVTVMSVAAGAALTRADVMAGMTVVVCRSESAARARFCGGRNEVVGYRKIVCV